MRDIESYAVDDEDANVGPCDKTFGESSEPLSKSTPTLVDVLVLDKYMSGCLDGKDVAMDSLNEEKPQMKRKKPQEKKSKVID